LTDSKTAQIPFVFITSMPEKIDKSAALEMDAHDFLVKPFELKSFLAVLVSTMFSGTKNVSVK
jgi:DNA-binding response OmpR family regulator